jgi:hypothetical protein
VNLASIDIGHDDQHRRRQPGHQDSPPDPLTSLFLSLFLTKKTPVAFAFVRNHLEIKLGTEGKPKTKNQHQLNLPITFAQGHNEASPSSESSSSYPALRFDFPPPFKPLGCKLCNSFHANPTLAL